QLTRNRIVAGTHHVVLQLDLAEGERSIRHSIGRILNTQPRTDVCGIVVLWELLGDTSVRVEVGCQVGQTTDILLSLNQLKDNIDLTSVSTLRSGADRLSPIDSVVIQVFIRTQREGFGLKFPVVFLKKRSSLTVNELWSSALLHTPCPEDLLLVVSRRAVAIR